METTPAGRVYVLWAEGTALFKVGYTKRDVSVRAGDIQAMSPLPLRIVATSPGWRLDEQFIHTQLRRYRSHGEWFRLPETAVRWLLGWCGISSEQIASASGDS